MTGSLRSVYIEQIYVYSNVSHINFQIFAVLVCKKMTLQQILRFIN